MAVAQRLESLRTQHAAVEAVLRTEMTHAWHDDSRVKQLKARKLRLKDAISELRLVASESGECSRCRD